MAEKKGSKIMVPEAIKATDQKKREIAFEESIVYYPEDCYNLLEAILDQSPYNPELAYAVHWIDLNPD